MGIVGNILAGVLLQRFGSFSAMFLLTAALYVSSYAVWVTVVRGERIYA